MVTKKIEILISASSEAELAQKEKALPVFASTFSGQEHEKLRQIILYQASLLSKVRQFLRQ